MAQLKVLRLKVYQKLDEIGKNYDCPVKEILKWLAWNVEVSGDEDRDSDNDSEQSGSDESQSGECPCTCWSGSCTST